MYESMCMCEYMSTGVRGKGGAAGADVDISRISLLLKHCLCGRMKYFIVLILELHVNVFVTSCLYS